MKTLITVKNYSLAVLIAHLIAHISRQVSEAPPPLTPARRGGPARKSSCLQFETDRLTSARDRSIMKLNNGAGVATSR